MFEDIRRAWQEAVANFWREVRAEEEGLAASALREVGRARTQLEGLDGEIADARRRLGEERGQAEVCDRRARMARRIGDAETERVARAYAARHRERASVLERKADALEAERALCRRDLDEMERAVQAMAPRGPGHVLHDLDRDPAEAAFRDLEDAGKARAAAERLEELKRRMGRTTEGGG